MKLYVRSIIGLCICLLCYAPLDCLSQSHIVIDSPEYEFLKQSGKLSSSAYSTAKSSSHSLSIPPSTSSIPPSFFRTCKEFIAVDSSYLVAPFDTGFFVHAPFYRNDDKSTPAIPIPFTFCFYGQTYSAIYINNNGSISFGAGYGTFVPDSFPTQFYKMIAPFWADVDTRNLQSGLVYYKIEPTRVVVTWDHVGYYSSHSDKKNTFQLIITNGNDSILGPGKNVSFRYDEMQWTTGDIGGINGFTDPAATVGVNLGDSASFIQLGRFSKPGDSYDGPFKGWDGISWLNGRVFEFNTCSEDNIEPIVSNFNYCDTIFSCVGDTSFFDFSFFAPERNQITTTAITTTAPSGLIILQNLPATANNVKAMLLGKADNVGIQHVYFVATDNGVIPATTALDIVVKVNSISNEIKVTGGGVDICPNSTTPLGATIGFDTYRWSNNAVTNPMNAPPGDYFVTGKLGNCYLISDTVHVGAKPVVIPIISGNTSQLCHEDSVLLSTTTLFPSYLWSNGDTTQSAYVHPGISTVTITDTSGCAVKSNSFFVPSFVTDEVNVGGIKMICPEDSAFLVVTNNQFVSYLWTTGDTGYAARIPFGLHMVTAIDTNGCKNFSPLFFIPNFSVTKPLLSGSLNYCSGDSVLLSVSPTFINYYWNTTDTVDSIFVQQGNYFVAVLDSNQCKTFSDTLTVNSLPVLPVQVLGNLNYCPGDSVLLAVDSAFTNCIWSFGDSAQFVYLQSGNYFVTAEDSNGCTKRSANLQVQEFSVTSPLITGPFFACPNDSVILSVSQGFTDYSWSIGDSSTSVSVPSGNYFVMALDSHSCFVQSSTFSVQNYTVKIPTISGNTFCCVNDSALLLAEAGFLNYLWSSGNTSSMAILPPGTYSVEVIDSNNCESTSAIFNLSAYAYSLPTINGNATYCLGDSTVLFVNPTFANYSWSNGTSQPSVSVQSGTHFATVTDVNNCTFKTADFVVQQYPVLVPQVLGQHFYCDGDSVALHISPGFTQTQWSSGSTADSVFVQAGNYSVVANDSNACKSYSPLFVVSISQPQVQIFGAQTICDADSLQLALNANFATYLWSNGSQQPTIYATKGNHFVEVSDSLGCVGFDSVSVATYNLPKSFFGYEPVEPESNEPVQFLNASQGMGDSIISYSWSIQNAQVFSSQSNPLYSFADSGNYTIQLAVVSSNGCVSTYAELIHVNKTIKIPNIITPNGDGENDIFEIKNLNLSLPNRLVIFDRWGKTIFSSNDYQNDWDARNMSDGVYYYSLRLEGEKEIRGSLTVVR